MKRIVRAAVLAAFAWAMGIAHGHHGADPARELPLWQVGLVVAAVALAVGVAGGIRKRRERGATTERASRERVR